MIRLCPGSVTAVSLGTRPVSHLAGAGIEAVAGLTGPCVESSVPVAGIVLANDPANERNVKRACDVAIVEGVKALLAAMARETEVLGVWLAETGAMTPEQVAELIRGRKEVPK